ncbi:Lysosomal amino acid transporter 1 like protein [Tritrichomonas foetus]|uniref:Lysosomal amino acid transporter 1 like protein n=1 Tax=Tritrichomonas foetus TaxID=1144522 RepID=A0A1J4JVH9_9EUKA|nr:Lysosomal amino acid transporter 1 like protein [Tritrichomonas foetus]|eukprot:OHT02440.1 Lysosomal amino acid transporter 1 like protein [Tritrichomonas foetus]
MSLSGECIGWISDIFGDCVSTPAEQVGFFFGLLSTVIWMYAQFPQIVMNFKRKSVDGLSFSFIILLNVGDTCNLVGVIINGGLITQIITAIWFLIVDLSCLLQYIWYNWIKAHCRKTEYADVIDEKGVNCDMKNNHFQPPSMIPMLMAVASSSNPYEPPQLYGSILGWISAVSYMSSRMPQIITNFQRKRTEGLSIQFFWSAVAGNTTYALSIFLKDCSWEYIWSQFPWMMGSAGILVFDFIVLVQFLVYRKNSQIEDKTATTEGSVRLKPYIADQLY